MNTIKTKIYYYRYSIDNEEELTKYNELKADLKSKGLKLFDAISMNQKHGSFKAMFEPLNNTIIELETKYIFNNQWNTPPTKTSENGLRVFDWQETIYPNRKIKEGQYLEQTEEMQEVRKNTFKCGYCGKHYNNDNLKFCIDCFDSEYLEESELFLLRLQNSYNEKRQPLTEEEKNSLVPVYVRKQIEGKAKRNELHELESRNKIKAEYLTNTENAKIEFNGLTWLMDNNISIDNVMYHEHTRKFSFGWKHSIKSNTVKNELERQLKKFPYQYEIKTEN